MENNVSANASDLAFNGASFTYNTVELIGCQVLAGITLHVEIRKHSGSNVTTAPVMQVILNESAVGTLAYIPASVNNFVGNEHIEIIIYTNNLRQNVLTRQVIRPVTFSF